MPSGIFSTRRQHEGNTRSADGLKKASRLREAVIMPSCSHRIIVRWNDDATTMLYVLVFQCIMLLCNGTNMFSEHVSKQVVVGQCVAEVITLFLVQNGVVRR